MQTQERKQRALYESLARYEWLRRRLSGARAGERLDLHKRLTPPSRVDSGPGAGTSGLHAWMWQRLEASENPRILDVGCGFGGTLIAWAQRCAGTYVGLGLSRYQLQRASQQARSCGVAERCEFRRQSYDQPIQDTFDRIVSVEALFHATDLPRALANLARSLADGGRLVLVEDVASGPTTQDDAAAQMLIQAWGNACIHDIDAWHAAAAHAGLAIDRSYDLSEQVPARQEVVLARSERRLRRFRRACPLRSGRLVADAFLGGIALERLYGKRLLRYLCLVLRVPA